MAGTVRAMVMSKGRQTGLEDENEVAPPSYKSQPLVIRVTRAVRAIAICKDKQTILECGKEVAPHS